MRVLETCFSRFGDGKKKRHRLIDGSQAFCQAGEKISDKIPLEINETKNSELVYVKLLCCTRLLIISNKTLTRYVRKLLIIILKFHLKTMTGAGAFTSRKVISEQKHSSV